MADELLHSSVVSVPPKWGDRAALVHAKGSFTYDELNQKVLGASAWLKDLGCSEGDRVAICLPKRPEAVFLILGALHAGCVYVPLDPEAPPDRVRQMVESTGAKILFSTDRLAKSLTNFPSGRTETTVVQIPNGEDGKGLDALMGSRPASAAHSHMSPDATAAIFFTSGSSGAPKGVTLSHRNISSFVDWAANTFEISHNDRLTSHAPFYFDLSTFDLFAAFNRGASVYLLTNVEKMFPAKVSEILEREKISVWYSVPTALKRLLESGILEKRDLASLRLVLFAGEVFPPDDLRQLMKRLPQSEFVNLYGPTETNVCAFYRLPRPPEENALDIPIGLPCEHLEVTVRDQTGKELGVEETGEICVSGVGVMQGYWGNPELSEQMRVDGKASSYRTGDIGCWGKDGLLRFKGRKDRQVKIRGYRVELEEIEITLRTCPQISDAAVYLKTSSANDQILAVVMGNGQREEIKSDARRACAEKLPAYSCPDQVLVVKEFPRFSNGKLDRETLLKNAQAGVKSCP